MDRRQLPVVQPCHEDFEAMKPEGAGRHCSRCRTRVHDLSAMTRDQAQRLLLRHRGRSICIRYVSGPDDQVRFRAPPPRRAGPLPVALAGLMAACTGPTAAIEASPDDDVAWVDDGHTTIPRGERDPRSGLEVAGGVESIIVDVHRYGHVTMGAMVSTVVACEPPPLASASVRPRPPRSDDEGRRVRGRKARRLARKQRKAARRERRRARAQEREHRQAEREVRHTERLAERETRHAEREAEARGRRAERLARRLQRKAERLARRAARRAEHQARRATRRAERLARRLQRKAERLARRA